jgi:hypothetical protein
LKRRKGGRMEAAAGRKSVAWQIFMQTLEWWASQLGPGVQYELGVVGTRCHNSPCKLARKEVSPRTFCAKSWSLATTVFMGLEVHLVTNKALVAAKVVVDSNGTGAVEPG